MMEELQYRPILPKPGAVEILHDPALFSRNPRRTRKYLRKKESFEATTLPKAYGQPHTLRTAAPFTGDAFPEGFTEVESKAFGRLQKYMMPPQEHLSFEKLASVLDPNPDSAPPLWRRVFNRVAELATFYHLDDTADVPRISKCVRIRKERNSSLQYVLVPTVYLHGQELSSAYVSAILGSDVLRNFEDVTKLLRSLESTGIGEEERMEDDGEDEAVSSEGALNPEDQAPAVSALSSMFATSSEEPSSLFTLQSQFTSAPLRLHPSIPKPSISFIPVVNNPTRIAPVRKKPKDGALPFPVNKSSSLKSVVENGDILNSVDEELSNEDEEASVGSSSTSSEPAKVRKRRAQKTSPKKSTADRPSVNKFQRARRNPEALPVRSSVADSHMTEETKTNHAYSFLKQPFGVVPSECVEIGNFTAPWFFSIPGERKVVLHAQYPEILIEEEGLLALQQESHNMKMYKWCLFIQLIGGERGLERVSSLWTHKERGQMKKLFFGKTMLLAIDQHCVHVQKAGIIPVSRFPNKRRDPTSTLLSNRIASWRSKKRKEGKLSPAPEE